MCKCRTAIEHAERSQYVTPVAGDDVVRFGDVSDRVGLLYHLDAYAGGLPRAHVVYDDGSSESTTQFLFQSPESAASDPCWS
jgi:hypothetical protein